MAAYTLLLMLAHVLQSLVNENSLENVITLEHQRGTSPIWVWGHRRAHACDVCSDADTSKYFDNLKAFADGAETPHATMCNPPFYEGDEDAAVHSHPKKVVTDTS